MFQSIGQRSVGKPIALALLLLGLGACAPVSTPAVSASEPVGNEPDPISVTLFTEKAQLFMEYPRLYPGLESRFLAHVTVLATGEPVRSGALHLELTDGPDGARVLEAPRPTRDGLFIPVGTFQTPGKYQAQIVVTSDQPQETIPLKPIVVYADFASALAASKADHSHGPAEVVPFLLEQQWKIGLLMHQVQRRTLTKRLQVPGEVEAPQHAMAVASAPIAGRLLPPEFGGLPHLGSSVAQGQVLGILEPALTPSDLAQLASNEANLDTLEMELLMRDYDTQAKVLEIELALQQSETQLDFTRRTLTRIEALRSKDLGTEAELEAARRDVELAKRANEGAAALKASYADAAEQLTVLRERSADLRSDGSYGGLQRQEIMSPISGEVVQAEYVEGEHVESQSSVFRVLDLSRVWITAHVSEFDLAEINDAPGALLQFAAYPERTFDVYGDMMGELVHFGRVVDPETRTLALRYEVDNSDGLLHAGMFADVFLETSTATGAVAVPKEAILMDNGQPIAFVLVHGEAFHKRTLELGIHDGEYVEVRSGIRVGDRVVTKGAYLVKLASASPAEFGHGHAH